MTLADLSKRMHSLELLGSVLVASSRGAQGAGLEDLRDGRDLTELTILGCGIINVVVKSVLIKRTVELLHERRLKHGG